MKKFVLATTVTLAFVGFTLAEEITGRITKVDAKAGTITYVKGGFGKKKDTDTKSEPVTATVAKGAVIAKGMFNKDDMTFSKGDAIEKGLENELFSNEKGVFARITIADEAKGDVKKGEVTQILVVGGKKGKGK